MSRVGYLTLGLKTEWGTGLWLLRGFAGVALAFALASGCETTTIDKGSDYTLTDAKSGSVLDSQLKRLTEEAEKYPMRSDLRYQIAAVHYQKADYRESAKELEKAIALSPDDAKYHYHLARVYLCMRELSPAEKHFRRATRLLPQDRYTGPHAALAYVLAEEKKLEEAIGEFEKCTAIEPENPLFYYFLGVLHDMKDDREKTIQNFQEYLILGGKIYRRKAVFILEKLGVKVEDLPPPKRTPEEEELFGSTLEGGGSSKKGEDASFERAMPKDDSSPPKSGGAPRPLESKGR